MFVVPTALYKTFSLLRYELDSIWREDFEHQAVFRRKRTQVLAETIFKVLKNRIVSVPQLTYILSTDQVSKDLNLCVDRYDGHDVTVSLNDEYYNTSDTCNVVRKYIGYTDYTEMDANGYEVDKSKRTMLYKFNSELFYSYMDISWEELARWLTERYIV